MVAKDQLLLFAARLNVPHHLHHFLGEVVNHLQSFVAVTSPSVWNRCESQYFDTSSLLHALFIDTLSQG